MVSHFLKESLLWHIDLLVPQTLCIFASCGHFPLGMSSIWGIWSMLVEEEEINSFTFIAESAGFTRAGTSPTGEQGHLGRRTDSLPPINLLISEVSSSKGHTGGGVGQVQSGRAPLRAWKRGLWL